MTATRLVVAAGLVALLAVAGLFLSETSQRRSGTDLTPNNAFIKGLAPGSQICQGRELLPADTSALQMTMGTYGHPGPLLAVRFTGPGGRTLTTGYLKAGWKQGVTKIPVAHVSQPTAETTFCMRNLGSSVVALAGYGADLGYSLRLDNQTFKNQRLRIDYLRPGRESWFELIPTIIHRFSLAKADFVRVWAWVAVLVAMLLAVTVAVVMILKPDGMNGRFRGIPRAAWLCALVALANGFAWSLITPPFQVPDENAHYAYVQQVAERGTLPHLIAKEGALSLRQDFTMAAINTFSVVGYPENPAPFSELQQQVLDRVANENLTARGTGDALTATANPPFYYLLQVIPYKLTPGGKVLDRLELMRLVSVLMGAATVLLVFLFLSELLPARRWAWTAGALLVAFQPMFAFISSGVNNDALLFLTATGLLWAIARAFRRGLDVHGGIAIGAFLGIGLVTKLTLLAFVPAVVVALALLLGRSWRSASRRKVAIRGILVAVGFSVVPIGIYELLARTIWNRGAIPLSVVNVPGSAVVHKYDFREELSHIWQLFLPPLGHMRHQFTDLPLWVTWFKGLVGRFGWLDYGFPEWAYWSVLGVAGVLVLLALAELTRCRRTLVRRLDELAIYLLALGGLCVVIGVESYREYIENGGQFEQARYLLPVIGLYAAIGALAVRFGGRRFGPALAAAVIVLAIGHDLFAQAISIARYYT